MADIPAGTGLGSSGSFTTALLKALHTLRKNIVRPAEIAAQACQIEIEILKEPVGKQDQYIAAYGGITCFRFGKTGQVEAWPLRLSRETQDNLEDSLITFFTGFSRASAILQDQDSRTKSSDQSMVDNLHFVKELGLRSKAALEQGDTEGFAALMHEHWEHKKKRSASMSNTSIDRWYNLGRDSGALGGKLVGAGAGGFLLFYAHDQRALRQAMAAEGLTEVRFTFDHDGSTVLARD